MAIMIGGCLCGRVRYSVNSEPLLSGLCHCRDCQRFTGSAFVAVMRIPLEAVTLTGELKTIDVRGSSGNTIRRHFCPNCSSPIFGEPYRPGMINLMVGTLDDPSVFKPTIEVFCDDAQPWVHDGAKRTRLPRTLG